MAVLWDMDGTLVDSEPLHEAALIAALKSCGITPPSDFHAQVVGRDARSIHAFCTERLGLHLALLDWLTLKYRTYFASLGRLQPREGALDIFLALRAEGVAQAIVSNSDRMVVGANLDAAGITQPGLITVSRNDVRDGKPAPEPYLRAAHLMGLVPADCTVVEDSATGARSGVAAGMRTLYWPQDNVPVPDGAVLIRDAAHLAQAVRER